ncbi:AAA family ATPase [Micromonospora narathiwatensis]|uniref:AAA ATPase domain-containing protein n=1 Tax=Micromonospora narathiwatensis TaxID=299146 RepID=A0A1A8ZLE4_9ACTN|nr:AAA family ATPase [Micromonospora narathiwatensis]SBT44671.1 AAA ATPase domain-containing protein [Micromonospora narathiwatensis]
MDALGPPAVGPVNPFSATAVARVSADGTDTITVVTVAIRDALAHLDNYLRTGGGGTVAVVGDYGTGKTHLAVELLAHARRTVGPAGTAIYLDAPADTFLSLSRRFLGRLSRDAVRALVAEWRAESPAPPATCDGDPEPATDPLPRRLREELAEVTADPSFGTVLAMLLDPATEAMAWDWLMGYPPGPALVAAGVTARADVEAGAVETMGVLALLHGRRHERFVLVLDELDKILSAAGRPGDEIMARFARMIGVLGSAGAFLVIAGLPDMLHLLSPDVRQRIGPIVRMSALSPADVREFIRQSQARAFGHARLAPFTEETTDYLTNLADGVPRRIIRLCYHLYQRAAQARTPVTHVMVREAVRVQFDLASRQDVGADVRRVLTQDGWSYQRDHLVGSMRDLPVDFWVPLDEQDAGCCVLLSESVLKSEEVDELNRRVVAIRAAVPDSEVILVVVGHLPTDHAADLAATFSVEPIVYDPQTFAEDLSGSVKALMRRLEQVVGADALTSVRQRVERIQRQQSNTQRSIERLSYQLDEMRGELHEDLRGPRLDAGSTIRRGPATGVASPLPGRVARVFVEAIQALDQLSGFERHLQDAFTPPRPGAGRSTEEGGAPLRSRLRSRDVQRALGTSMVLRRLIEAFRYGVEQWYERHSRDPQPADLEQLDRLCETYDGIAEYLPLFQLDALGDLATPGTGDDDAIDPPDRSRNWSGARSVFDGLSGHVRQLMVPA